MTDRSQSSPSVGLARRLLLTAILATLAVLSARHDLGRTSLAQAAWLGWTRAAWLVAPFFLAMPAT